MIYVDFINSEELIDFIKHFTEGTDTDIDKVQYRIPNEIDNSPEAVAYRRIASIANTEANKINWAVAIKCVTKDVNTISNLIRSNKIKHPEKLKEFVENVIAIYNYWDTQYREDFCLIKEYRDSVKIEKSIDEMDADELRDYIKKHNIK
jgi:hypothetical protein